LRAAPFAPMVNGPLSDRAHLRVSTASRAAWDMKQQARVVAFIISLVVFLLVASCHELYPQALTWPEVDCGRPSLNSSSALRRWCVPSREGCFRCRPYRCRRCRFRDGTSNSSMRNIGADDAHVKARVEIIAGSAFSTMHCMVVELCVDLQLRTVRGELPIDEIV
jgi:hypothetical protein